MTGSDVTSVREWLGVDPFAFAAALGVHVSSVYRWEKAKEPTIDTLQLSIIEGLRARMKSRRVGSDLGERVRTALVSRGNLGGIFEVLKFLVEGDKNG